MVLDCYTSNKVKQLLPDKRTTKELNRSRIIKQKNRALFKHKTPEVSFYQKLLSVLSANIKLREPFEDALREAPKQFFRGLVFESDFLLHYNYFSSCSVAVVLRGYRLTRLPCCIASVWLDRCVEISTYHDGFYFPIFVYRFILEDMHDSINHILCDHQEDADRNKKIVLDLLRRPENAFCADCGAKGVDS